MIKADEQVLKTDELGRVRTPTARRESLIQEFERSGLSGAKFAALTGIKYSTFASWLQKRRRRGGGGSVAVKWRKDEKTMTTPLCSTALVA